MEVLHWTVDVVEPDQGWNARWRNETDMSRWSMYCHIESEEGEDNARAAYISLYVRVGIVVRTYSRATSETLEEVAGKLQKWFRPHFGPGWSFQHLTYIYDPDLERAFDEGEKLKQMEFFAEMKKWSDNLAREEVYHGNDGEAEGNSEAVGRNGTEGPA